MRYDAIEVREVEVDGEIVNQVDGSRRPTPESEYTNTDGTCWSTEHRPRRKPSAPTVVIS